MDENQQPNKRDQARNTLPDDLKPVFDELVEDYKFATIMRFGRGYAAYLVLADLVRVGWRHAATPLPDAETKKENGQ